MKSRLNQNQHKRITLGDRVCTNILKKPVFPAAKKNNKKSFPDVKVPYILHVPKGGVTPCRIELNGRLRYRYSAKQNNPVDYVGGLALTNGVLNG